MPVIVVSVYKGPKATTILVLSEDSTLHKKDEPILNIRSSKDDKANIWRQFIKDKAMLNIVQTQWNDSRSISYTVIEWLKKTKRLSEDNI